MNVNGKNRLACTTRLTDLAEPVIIRPLPSLPVIRDLVVDMTQFYKQYEKAQPYLKNDTPAPATSVCSPGRACQAGWFVRMYFVALLHHLMPIILVESR